MSINSAPTAVNTNVSLSGINVVVNVSGQTVIAQTSGSIVSLTAGTINISGQKTVEFGTAVRAHAFTVVTNLSGGTEVGSGAVFAVTVRNHSGNGPMLLGGTGSEAPFSGKGMIVYGGESYDFRVDNFNRVRALAYTSGQIVSVAGLDL